MNKKVLSLLGLVFVIIIGVTLSRFFKDLPRAEAQDPAIVQVPTNKVPSDFDWKTYIQNYEDLRQAGIDTEKKAQQHWLKFGKSEGRDYYTLRPIKPDNAARPPDLVAGTSMTPAQSAAVAPVETVKSFAVSSLATSRSISRVSLDPPNFDPTSLRKKYGEVLQQAGIKTKEEAMEFSLAFWEKRRKIYFS